MGRSGVCQTLLDQGNMPFTFPVDTFLPVWQMPLPEQGPQQKQQTGGALEPLARSPCDVCFEVAIDVILKSEQRF